MAMDIPVVYNDAHLTVFCKPQGLSTMGASPSLHRSLALNLPKDEITTSKYKKCVPVHRLDKATGGLVLCSKSLSCEIYLKELFRTKEIRKRYIAIVLGAVESSEGTISSVIDGAEAVSEYRVTQRSRSGTYGWLSTVHLWPITGKQHQLRRHMKQLGHPIIGDRRYWNTRDATKPLIQEEAVGAPPSLHECFLWAVEISFLHPNGAGDQLTVAIDEPAIFDQLRDFEERKCQGSGSREIVPGLLGIVHEGSAPIPSEQAVPATPSAPEESCGRESAEKTIGGTEIRRAGSEDQEGGGCTVKKETAPVGAKS
jgi:23S rRNA-/tRNA-specific pseudouridylate synthase